MQKFTGKLVKIYIEGRDKYKHEALYKAIVEHIKEDGISGVTVIRGIEGFGDDQKIHETALEVLANSLPIVIESVVKEDKVAGVIEIVSAMIETGKVAVFDNITVYSF